MCVCRVLSDMYLLAWSTTASQSQHMLTCLGSGYDLSYGTEFGSVTCLDRPVKRTEVIDAVALVTEGDSPPCMAGILVPGVEARSVGIDAEVVNAVGLSVYRSWEIGIVGDGFGWVSREDVQVSSRSCSGVALGGLVGAGSGHIPLRRRHGSFTSLRSSLARG